MPLSKQLVPLIFQSGIDTKTDPKVLQGKLLELENAVFTAPGRLSKRNGYTQLSASIRGGATIDASGGLATFNEELIQFSGNRLYAYSDSFSQWIDRGALSPVALDERQVVRNSHEQSNPDAAYASGMVCVAWEDTRGGVHCTVLDNESGTVLLADTEVSPNGSRPRVVSFNGSFFVWYSNGNNLFYRRIAQNAASSLEVEVNPIATLDPSNQAWDVCAGSTRLSIVWGTTTDVYVGYLNTSSALTTGGSIDSRVAVAASVTLDSSGNAWYAYATNISQFVAKINSSDVPELIAGSLGSLANVLRIGLVATDTSNVTIVAETAGSSGFSYDQLTYIGSAYVPSIAASSITTLSVLARSVGLSGSPFVYSGAVYVPCVHESTLQSTQFLINRSGVVAARGQPGLSGGRRTKNSLCRASFPATSEPTYAITVRGAIESTSGTLYTRTGVAMVDLDFQPELHTAEQGNALHISGGILQDYDGTNLTEHGFLLFPENLSAVLGGAASGSIDAGAHQWIAIYEWTDASGQVHRSAPSGAHSETTAASDSATITVPTLRLTSKSLVRIVLYRTRAGLPTFHRVTDITSPLLNSTAVDSVSYVDSASDASIATHEVLYSDGTANTELENVAPDASSLVVSHRNRLFLKTGRNELTYSKLTVAGAPVEFSDALKVTCDGRGGSITAVGSLDDKLVIFKEQAIYVLAGEGPNNLGQGEYQDPILVTTDVGCSNPLSVVQTSAGLMFESSKGIYLIDRSLSTSYVGSPVESFNSLSIVSAVLVANTNQVRFGCSDGVALVFDYSAGQWSTFTNHEQVDALVWDGAYTFVKATGRVFKESSTSFTDNGTAVKLRLVTSWLSFAGVQGFQRVYHFLILGEYESSHKLRVRVGYDFKPEYPFDTTVDVQSLIGPTAWGSGATWGSDTVWGGAFPDEVFRVHPSPQKCTSMRVQIEDTDVSAEGYSITGLTFLVGAKQGTRKLAATRYA